MASQTYLAEPSNTQIFQSLCEAAAKRLQSNRRARWFGRSTVGEKATEWLQDTIQVV
jgi:hypothetical protein